MLRASYPMRQRVGLCRFGAGPTPGRRLTWGPQEAPAQELQVCAAEHVPLQHFQPVDMALDRPGGPGQGHPGFDRRIVLVQAGGEAAQRVQRTAGRALKPGIELGRLPLAHQGREILRQVDRLGHRGRLRSYLSQLLGIVNLLTTLSTVCDTPPSNASA